MMKKWNKSIGDILVPTGSEHRSSSKAKRTFVELSKSADQIRNIYKKEYIAIHPNSGLAKILGSADLGLKASLANDQSVSIEVFWNILHLERIAKALSSIKNNCRVREYLIYLKSGDLDFLQRNYSKAKNHLFELEVWRTLNVKHSAVLDEPDVKLTIGSINVGFACKKTYSLAGVPKVLSKAVKQIEANDCEFGMVAFNIDDLIPAECVVKKANLVQASDLLSGQCMAFLEQIERHLLKYFQKSKIIGALVSCSAIVDTPRLRPQFSNMQQWCIWTVPELDNGNLNAARRVRDFLNCK